MTTYIGLFINVESLTSNGINLLNISQQLQHFSSECNKISMGHGLPIQTGASPFQPLPPQGPSSIQAIILVLPEQIVETITLLSITDVNTWINSQEPFQHSLGHCYITYDKIKDVCGIYDICLHNQYLYQKGNGSILFEAVLDTLLSQLPNSTTLWLGIHIDNQHFENVAALYSKFGFTAPFMSDSDPFGNIQAFLFLSLSRLNDYIDPLSIDRESTLNEILYTITQYKKASDGSPCIINAYFNKSYAKWLRKLSLSASTLNPDGSITQKEVGGAFVIEKPKKSNIKDQFVWEITFDKNKGINVTNEESVVLMVGRYNFHTHPRALYNKYKVTIGTPSGPDYVAFLKSVLLSGTVFHCVISVEGIYIIYINPYWTTHMKELVFNIKAVGIPLYEFISSNFEIPFNIRYVIKNDIIAVTRLYIDIINNKVVFDNKPPIFKVSFLSWEEVDNTAIIHIPYPIMFSQCFATELSTNSLLKLHNNPPFNW